MVLTVFLGVQDGKVEPEDFTSRLQKELKSSPQPYLVPFLKVNLTCVICSTSYIKGVWTS